MTGPLLRWEDLASIARGEWSDGVVGLDWYGVDDAVALHACDRDAEHRRRFELPEGQVPSIEHARSVIVAWERERDAGTRFAIAVRLASGECVAGCEVRPVEAGVVNLSYFTVPAQRGRGYCRRGVRLVCAWLDGMSGLGTVEVKVRPDNAASLAVAAACGFEPVGMRDGHLVHVRRER